MDSIKEAFQKVKSDMDSLKREMDFLKKDLAEISKKIIEISDKLSSANKPENQAIPTHSPTHLPVFKPIKPQNTHVSTGNDGVPTDKQTNQQTNQHTETGLKTPQNPIENASEILDSLDNIKKEIRLKFKGITEQELLVFSTIYQMDEEKGFSDYKLLSQRLNLSESSIRDYVGKLIKKGIPVDKKRINNKNVRLSVSQNLKKIASLSTILKLREL